MTRRVDPVFLKARFKALSMHPYDGDAIASMIPVQGDVGTCAVDKYWRCYYDVKFLSTLSVNQAAGVVLHEVYHLLDRHAERAELLGINKDMEDPELHFQAWNLACDASINERLLNEGVELPDGKVTPDSIHSDPGKTPEQYYRHILKMIQDGKIKVVRIPSGGVSMGGIPNEPCSGKNGSGADGRQRDYEHGEPDGSKGKEAGERPDKEGPGNPDGIDKNQADEIRQSVANARREHQKSRGSHGGNFESTIDSMIEPLIDPKSAFMAKLRRSCTETVGGVYPTYKRMSKKRIPGILLPAKMDKVPNITVIVDTSGSMYGQDLELCLGLINKVMRTLNIRNGLNVVTGDTSAKTRKIICSKMGQLPICGGGGTDMGKIIVEVADQKPKPEMIIVATDGYTPWPKQDVGVPTFACLTQSGCEDGIPDWIKTVILYK